MLQRALRQTARLWAAPRLHGIITRWQTGGLSPHPSNDRRNAPSLGACRFARQALPHRVRPAGSLRRAICASLRFLVPACLPAPFRLHFPFPSQGGQMWKRRNTAPPWVGRTDSAAHPRHTAFAFSQPWLTIPHHSLIYYQAYATQAPSTNLKSWGQPGGGMRLYMLVNVRRAAFTNTLRGQCLVRLWHTTVREQCRLWVPRSAKAPPHFAKLISEKRAWRRSAALGGPSALPRAGRSHAQRWQGGQSSARRRRRVLRRSTQESEEVSP
jgi:hypothetical protein